jgi:hypothetical protein
MPVDKPGLIRRALAGAAAVCTLVLGCADASGVGKTYPVGGKLSLNNEAFTAESTVVLFKPDAGKGNSLSFEPIGTVDDDGQYTVSTRGKSGAPPGWYKVVVTATAAPPEHAKTPKTHRPVARSLLPARYGQSQTTDLQIEVVEAPAPGAYDLKLTK